MVLRTEHTFKTTNYFWKISCNIFELLLTVVTEDSCIPGSCVITTKGPWGHYHFYTRAVLVLPQEGKTSTLDTSVGKLQEAKSLITYWAPWGQEWDTKSMKQNFLLCQLIDLFNQINLGFLLLGTGNSLCDIWRLLLFLIVRVTDLFQVLRKRLKYCSASVERDFSNKMELAI